MIKTVIKLAFVALVANATWHVFNAYSPHYKFKDGVTYAAQYRGNGTDEALREKVLSLAMQFEVPVSEDKVVISRDGAHTIVDLSYVRTVELGPGFRYPWPFTLHLDVLTSNEPPAPRQLLPK